MAEINLIIKDGKIIIDIDNVNDASCAELTASLEKALGVVDEVSYKPQYFNELDGIEIQVSED